MKTYNYTCNGNSVSVAYNESQCTITAKGQSVSLPRAIMANNIRNIESTNASLRTKSEQCLYHVWQAGTTRVG